MVSRTLNIDGFRTPTRSRSALAEHSSHQPTSVTPASLTRPLILLRFNRYLGSTSERLVRCAWKNGVLGSPSSHVFSLRSRSVGVLRQTVFDLLPYWRLGLQLADSLAWDMELDSNVAHFGTSSSRSCDRKYLLSEPFESELRRCVYGVSRTAQSTCHLSAVERQTNMQLCISESGTRHRYNPAP